MPNVAAVLETAARECPRKIAVISGESSLIFDEVNRAANRVANGLWRAGIRQGDKVALCCGTNPDFVVNYYGILKTGAVIVPLSTLLKGRELANELAHSGSVGLICAEGSPQLPIAREGWSAFHEVDSCKTFWLIPNDADAAQPPDAGMRPWRELLEGQPETFETEQTGWDDTCEIVYTSGTTGRAKGAELTHGNAFVHCLVFKDVMGYRRSDKVLIAVPLFNVFGQFLQMGAAFAVGATLVFPPRFEPGAVLNAMRTHETTIFSGVPTMMRALLHYPELGAYLDDVRKTWRAGICGGAPVPPELLEEVKRVFGVQLLVGYGLSETTCAACTTRYTIPVKPGSIGIPIFGVELRIVDGDVNDVPIGETGEVVIRGHNIMKGYYGNPEANEEAFKGGWFHSGDIGKRDEDGYFYILDRKKDMIIRSGRKVYPSEVEAELLSHPDITLAAVLGVPDEERGEEIKAFIVPRHGTSLTPDEIIRWSREHLGAHMYPRYVEIRQSIPLGPTGKILKAELRKSVGLG